MGSDETIPPHDAAAGRSRRLTRRTLLQLGGVIGGAGVAGCQLFPESDTPRTSVESPTPRGTTPRKTTAETADGGSLETIHFDGGGATAFAAALRDAESNPGSTLEIADGTYRLDGRGVGREQPHTHFTADGLESVSIEGNDALLVLEDPTLGALGLFNSAGVTVRNLRIDYDPPPLTQATITGVDEPSGAVDVEIHEGFPGFDSPALSHPALTPQRRFATVHDAETGDFLDEHSGGATTLRFDSPERTGERRYRLPNVRPWRGLSPGRHLVVVARLPFKHGLLLVDCAEPTVENVTVHVAPAFSVLAALCEAPVFRSVTVTPRRDAGRHVGSTADGIHALGCAPGPTIEDCHMERLQDDAYVVAALMNRVERLIDDRTVAVDPVVATRVRPGDDLEAIGSNFERRGRLPAVTGVETTNIRLPGEWGWPIRVTFDAPVGDALGPGDFLRNVSRSNQGFVVRNCTSREIRSRHVRVTSRNGVVEGNELHATAMPAVMLAGGTFFEPQSPPEDVTVRNNTITRAGPYGFTTPFRGAIDAWIHLGRWRAGPRPPGQPIRNLAISGNTIRGSAFAGIHVNDAEGVTIENNVIEAPNRLNSDGDRYAIGLVNDRDVAVVGNHARGSAAELDQFGHRSDTPAVETRNNRLTIGGRSVTPEFVETSGEP